jgi:hypothetical protein
MKFERAIWIFRIDWGARQVGKGMKRRRRMEGEGEDEDEKEKEKRRYGVALFK